MSARLRLDEAVVAAGLLPSRARARDAIRRGTVTVNGETALKPATPVTADAALAIGDPAAAYVSRAAMKLRAGLDAFGFEPEGLTVLDLGASTGGFTQLLLETGAKHVVAIDVGHGQMHESLSGDPRVQLVEGVNARNLSKAHLDGHSVQAITADLSFISLRLALPPALELAARGSWGVFLVKPQFELGREALGRGGIVRDRTAAEGAAEALKGWLDGRLGWRVVGLCAAPFTGGDGNQEFCLGACRE
ncbi:TlyA family RNA methyltransferase [Afifella marina]|uniref:23S rRNA (Cytidine1920-2'-O)/16S rRNA (Cytidine1409-2'-O)-methyltransferase n=1 Tax=Afifella marina DSM 2698 TaxID=1120955 RepID=A0A1G5M9T6_AFIMA|nr:TlyA family RNA methyltransferase [Afifella marina]MBK1622741.1 TlyA family RNA methyltransferase [Afifella marina DSM 2698]MBK1625736.1 TlyA family RNA methyltransferase [Afifella marina]MBK5917559.1 TlyA family rRNA (cytidine-2'-O)-methyltransferase [Afifella marina]RAI23490.1 TlyA family rRNA (cytidine-2'-O)-methyltransferase [Afifella marina DSM 2698]SCZ21943.1 23S rRNA (cytidine1920-2'-O)/16S rRNA (cytidine1409-2'-O)-methyltransferase [Afifella marina DSM 2698]